MVAVFLAGSERDGAAMQTMPGAMTTISGQIRSRRRGRGRILLGGWRGGDLRGAGGGPAAGLELQRPPFRWTGLPTSPATPRRPTGPPPPRPRPARPLGAPGRTRGFTCGGAGDHCPLGEETAAKATARAPVTSAGASRYRWGCPSRRFPPRSFIEASATHKAREVKPSSILYLSRCCVQPAACLLCCLKEGSGALDVEDGDKEK
ncbi:hypothetical protein VPH35_055086 [Triticum aestivum]